jgi:hypothetical protein
VPATPIHRPRWLRVTSTLATAGIVVWPILAMLGLLGAVPAQVVLNVGLVTAGLAYVSIHRIKHDRAMAQGPLDQDSPGEDPA